MQKKMRKSFIILFSAIIAAMLFLAGAFMLTFKTTAYADAEDEPLDLYWKLVDGTLTLSSYKTDGDDFQEYTNYNTAWWSRKSEITSVTVDTYAYAPQSLLYWFNNCTLLETADLTGLDTSGVTSMSAMFHGCGSLTSLDLSMLDTSNVVDIGEMFKGCGNLATLNLSSFDTTQVTNTFAMFYGCNSLTTIHTPLTMGAEALSLPDTADWWDVTKEEMITTSVIASDNAGGHTIKKHAAHEWDWSHDENSHWHACKICNDKQDDEAAHTYTTGGECTCGKVAELYWGVDNNGALTLSSDGTNPATPHKYVDEQNFLSKWDSYITSVTVDTYAYAPQSLLYWFNNCTLLETADLTGLDTSRVTSMRGMFDGCLNLVSLTLSSSFDTTNVTTMNRMFNGCNSLTSLDLSDFNTANVTDMFLMFFACTNLESLDVSSFNTANVTTMHCMFDGCSSLTSLDLSDFNTANVTDTDFMFDRCNSLNEIQTPQTVGSVALPLPCRFMYADASADGTHTLITSVASADVNKTVTRHEECSGGNATCIQKAVCEVCRNEYGGFAAHTLNGVEQVDKTCTEDGVLAHDHCSVCNKDFIDGVEKSAAELKIAAGHTWDSNAVRVEPTCEADGSVTGTCTVCGTNDVEVLPKLGHNFGEWTVTKEATEAEEGEERRVCTNDDTHFETRPIPKLVVPDNNGGLSAGAIAGIVIACILFALLAVYVACYFALYRRDILLKGKLFDAIYVPMNAIFGKKEQEENS